jgi:hypothetical protein
MIVIGLELWDEGVWDQGVANAAVSCPNSTSPFFAILRMKATQLLQNKRNNGYKTLLGYNIPQILLQFRC